MKQQIRFLFFGILLIVVQVNARTEDPLVEVVKVGVGHAFAIESQKLKLEQAVNQVPISRASLLPTLSLASTKSLSGSESVDSTTGAVTYASSPSTTLSLSADWTLWDNFASIRKYQVARKALDTERVNSRLQVQQYILNLISAYLDYQYNLNQREILSQKLAQSKLTNEESQALVHAGAKTPLDAMDTEIEVLNTQRDLLDLDNKITTAVRALQVLVNSEQIKELPRLDLLKHEPYYANGFDKKIESIRQSWQKKVEELNPDLQVKRMQLEQTQMNLSQTKLGYFPTTKLSLNHTYTMDRLVQDDPTAGRRVGLNSNSVSFSLSWQFWDWLSTPYSIANSQKDYESQLLSYRQSNLQTQADLESQIKDFAVLEKTIEASRLVVQKAVAQSSYSQEMYRLGRLTLLEIQQATTRLSDARSALASRLKERSVLQAKLMYATGFDLTPPGLDLSWIQ